MVIFIMGCGCSVSSSPYRKIVEEPLEVLAGDESPFLQLPSEIHLLVRSYIHCDNRSRGRLRRTCHTLLRLDPVASMWSQYISPRARGKWLKWMGHRLDVNIPHIGHGFNDERYAMITAKGEVIKWAHSHYLTARCPVHANALVVTLRLERSHMSIWLAQDCGDCAIAGRQRNRLCYYTIYQVCDLPEILDPETLLHWKWPSAAVIRDRRAKRLKMDA